MTREEAIYCLDHKDIVTLMEFYTAVGMAIRVLKQPEQKRSKWIEDGYQGEASVCSYCGMPGEHEWKYCPNCGAKMEG